MEAPVATTTSIILYLIMSEYIFIQPAAEVEPARVKNVVQFLSDNISLNILDALAVSLEVKDILSIESIIFLESKDVISMCSTGFSKKVFLL